MFELEILGVFLVSCVLISFLGGCDVNLSLSSIILDYKYKGLLLDYFY